MAISGRSTARARFLSWPIVSTTRNSKAEALCWLKIWVELYPNPSRNWLSRLPDRHTLLADGIDWTDLARDAFYLALAHSVNEAEVHDAEDVKRYMRLTDGTLWAMAANEYENGQWSRGAELFARYRKEATSARPAFAGKGGFSPSRLLLPAQADRQGHGLYEETMKAHPFNPLAPEARLRLYHLYVVRRSRQGPG